MGPGEPESPVMIPDEAENHSNESHSSDDRTKVESRSHSSNHILHPSNKDNAGLEADYTHLHHQPDDYVVYTNRPHQQRAYGSSDPFSPSPSAYGRYQQGSYGNDGLESARVSTIGTDSFHTSPFNSSRTALNQDWCNSALASQDGTTVDEKFHAGQYPSKDLSNDPKDLVLPYVPIPLLSLAINEKRAPPAPAEGIISPPPVVVT